MAGEISPYLPQLVLIATQFESFTDVAGVAENGRRIRKGCACRERTFSRSQLNGIKILPLKNGTGRAKTHTTHTCPSSRLTT